MSSAKILDQFYTSPALAEACTAKLLEVLPHLGYTRKLAFLEPSAGTGAFITPLVSRSLSWFAGDLEPKYPGVLKKDFLDEEFKALPSREELVTLGNPPFGKKSKLALEFLARSFDYCDTVAFVLPLQFQKYGTQRLIHPGARLVYDEVCPEKSFIFKGEDYSVRCVFQIWTLRESNLKNQRILTRPPTNHPDFDAWIYNATEDSKRFFSMPWEIAIRRQGWEGFTPTLREDLTEPLSDRIQWILLKPRNDEVRKKLLEIDYETLANRNTSVRGFGKADLVEEYKRLYGIDPIAEGLFAS